MKFKLDTSIPDYAAKIDHRSRILLLGSCFSDEMAKLFLTAGFDICANPYGTIFHPLPLARMLSNALLDATNFYVFENNSTFFSWNASNLLQAEKEQNAKLFFEQKQQELKEKISNASHIFITLGSAWGYRHKEEQIIVANCHKQRSDCFVKELTSSEEMLADWSKLIGEIKRVNPNCELIFTVSPVRHSKDGLPENNRSKARLFELIQVLEDQFQVAYFPSYEIVIDELRDYRFFKEDLVHPNELAIKYIWEKVKQAFFTEKTLDIIRDYEKLNQLEQHHVRSSKPFEVATFEKQRQQKIQDLQTQISLKLQSN